MTAKRKILGFCLICTLSERGEERGWPKGAAITIQILRVYGNSVFSAVYNQVHRTYNLIRVCAW